MPPTDQETKHNVDPLSMIGHRWDFRVIVLFLHLLSITKSRGQCEQDVGVSARRKDTKAEIEVEERLGFIRFERVRLVECKR